MKKICIATYEIEKIHKNGGIATAYKHMADVLVQAGFDVTIFITSNNNFSKEEKNIYINDFLRDKIKLIFPKEILFNVSGIKNTYCSYQAYRTFETLKEYEFDIIHLPDSSGDAYFIVNAKKTGLYFKNTTIIVGAHGSSEWVRESNENSSQTLYDYILDDMEKKSIEYADYVVSPSIYYINWMKEHNFKLPLQTLSILNCPHIKNKNMQYKKINGCEIKEIVFFGRLERRKGFDIFCEAIINTDLPDNIAITFLGKRTDSCNFDSYKERFNVKKNKVKFIENYNSQQAIDYLSKKNLIAVIPSRSETMSYTVMECLLNEIPFIAANTGAINELIDKKYHNEVLFALGSDILKNKIEKILKEGLEIAIPSFQNENIIKSWINLHNSICNKNHCDDNDTTNISYLTINGNNCKLENNNYKSEILINRFDDNDLIKKIELLKTDYILLSFNTELSIIMKRTIKNIYNKENIAIVFANYKSNGAFFGTSTSRENFELMSSNQFLQFFKDLPIPNSCVVRKDELLKFIKLHSETIKDSYYFMKIFLLYLILSNIKIYTLPIACGWSTDLNIEKIFELKERMLWTKYYRKIYKIYPDFLSRNTTIDVTTHKHKDLTREEKLRAKFIKSPKKFFADSKYLPLRIISKFLNQ